MYERNAIVIDRYFSSLFGYDKSSNIKTNANKEIAIILDAKLNLVFFFI